MAWSMADVLGQDRLVHRIAGEFAAGRASHAYMLEGQAGTGKLTLARGMAGMLLCEQPDSGTGNACGECRHCRLLAHGEHSDVLELPRGQAELRIARFVQRSGGTETVEHPPLLSFLRMRPVEGDTRVAIIPDAERLRTEAANAFLKTLEEPPGNAYIILTTSARDRLPATISSRCRRVGVHPLSPEMLAAEVERRGIAAGRDAADLAAIAEGSLGAAITLADGETLAFWRWLDGEALASPGAVAAKKLAEGWLTRGQSTGENAGKRQAALEALDFTALAIRKKLREGLSPEKGARAISALWAAADQVSKNVRPDVALLSCAFEVMAALR